jgi:hypothetical protein
MRQQHTVGQSGHVRRGIWRRGRVALAVVVALAATPAIAVAAAWPGATVPRQTDHAYAAFGGGARVPIRVTCPKGTVPRCLGTLSLKTSQKVNGAYRSLGSQRISIRPGKTGTVQFHVNQTVSGTIHPIATVVSRDGHGHHATHSTKITIKAASITGCGGYHC